jgi:hypothetical protein
VLHSPRHGGQYPGRRLTVSRTGEFDMSDEANVSDYISYSFYSLSFLGPFHHDGVLFHLFDFPPHDGGLFLVSSPLFSRALHFSWWNVGSPFLFLKLSTSERWYRFRTLHVLVFFKT